MTPFQAAKLTANLHLTRTYPVSLVHFVTNRCNARCSFCFIDFDDENTFRGELTIPEIERLSRSVGPMLQNVNLTGGEPFARKEILDIARLWYANTQIKSIFITSNGSLPDRMVPFAETLHKEFPDRKLIFSLSIDALPERHDAIRKIKGLFDKTMTSYHALRKIPGVMANIAITVSHENCGETDAIYDMLTKEKGVRALSATIVRDEGVYKIPIEKKKAILEAYRRLTSRIALDIQSGRLEGYDKNTLQGRLMNKKNALMNEIIADTYIEPRYISPCHAGSLFGVISADGTVHACEILDKPIGRLRDYEMNFNKLWATAEAESLRKWIRDTKCNCSYECAWSFNILGNLRYQPALIAAALKVAS